MKKYEEIKFKPTTKLDEAVNILQRHNSNGLLVKGEFNGKYLYSDTVTLDSAYKEVTGYTKKDLESGREKVLGKYKKKYEEHKKKIPELTKYWIEKGSNIVLPSKVELWKMLVPEVLKGTRNGKELEECIKVAEVLNNGGTFEEALSKINPEDYSGNAETAIYALIKVFCKNGSSFVRYVNKK